MSSNVIVARNPVFARGRLPEGFMASKGLAIKLLEMAEEKGRFVLSGYASTSELDLDGEIVLPSAFKKHIGKFRENPVYCWQHMLWDPIGTVNSVRITDDGLYFDEVELAKTDQVIMRYWPLIASRTVRSQSIGFTPIKWEDREVDGVDEPVRHYTEVRLWETSAVTLPANEGCRIDTAEEKGLKAYGKDAAKLFPALWSAEERGEQGPHVWSPGWAPLTITSSDSVWGSPGSAATLEQKAVVPFQDHALMPEDTAWSGARSRRELKSWATSGDTVNWPKYKRGFVWFSPDDAETAGGYKLPICYVIDGTPKAVLRGVMAAMAVILGARGGINIPDAERKTIHVHLSKYYAMADREPPEFRSADEVDTLRLALGDAYDAVAAGEAFGDLNIAVAWLLDERDEDMEVVEEQPELVTVYDPLAVVEQTDYEPEGLSIAPLSPDRAERVWEEWSCHLLYRTDTGEPVMQIAWLSADGEGPVLRWDRIVVALSQVLGVRSPWRLSPDVKAAALRKLWALYEISGREVPALALDAVGLGLQPDEVLKTVGWNDLLFRSGEKQALERHRFMQSADGILSIARHWASTGELPNGVARAAKEVAAALLLLVRNYAPAAGAGTEGELPRRDGVRASDAEALLGELLRHVGAAA